MEEGIKPEVNTEETKPEPKVLNLDELNPDFATTTEMSHVILTKKGDNVYRFEVPANAPITDCYEAAFEILKELKLLHGRIVKKIKEEAAKKAAEEAEDTPKE